MTANWPALEEGLERRLRGMGYELVELVRAGDKRRPVIRLRIEHEPPDRSVSLGDCGRVSRSLEAWLDADGGLGERYVLEVSSPGLERPLTRDKDFTRFAGRRVALVGAEALHRESSRVEGELLGLVHGAGGVPVVRLRLGEGDEVEVPRERVRRARLVWEWKGKRP